ncbi:MAG TPA: efflux RND transporter permease subunit [Gemmatimonadaceae bacterium]|nr:efflux RND transporter permease subunit [Gemmatimonadaceae bacterium]
MYISDFAIKRPMVTITTMLALVVFGLFALLRLDTDEFPDVQPPVITTSIVYPGASPDVVEREVTDPIEEGIAGLSGVKTLRSQSMDGFALIITEFQFSKDLAEGMQEIRDKISEIRGDLPLEMEEPILAKWSDTDQPILSIAIASNVLDGPELTRLVDPAITRELKSISGVADVRLAGAIERELTVELRPQALQASGVSIGQVVAALAQQNLAAPVGRINGALDERTIRLRGRLEHPDDFLQLVVAERNGQIIRLGQVATIRDGTEEPRTAAIYFTGGDGSLNGRDAIGLDIRKSKGFSTTDVADRVKERLNEIQQRMPPGVQIDVVRDAGERVTESVSNVQEALLEGAALTVLVVFLFLNSWRSTVITGLALPVSVLASFIAVLVFGFTLNTMSLMGLSLAIGILIDDAIVVRENIVRHIEMGKDHFTASREGTDEIGLAVAATTFSIVSVFIPIAFITGIAGQWFKPFALTIACSVLVSLFVSFSLDPMLSAYWADPELEEGQHRNWLSRTLDRFNKWFNRQSNNYRKVVGWALDHRWSMVGLAAFSFVGAIALQATFGGGGFMPESDQSEILIVVETPPGSNLEYTRLKAEEAARVARAHPETKATYTTIGGTSGAVDRADVYVKMLPKSDRSKSQADFASQVRAELSSMAGATITVFNNVWAGNFKQIQLEIRGDDARVLAQLADQVAAVVRSVRGAVDVGLSTKGQKPELDVQLNRGVAGSLGITVSQVAQALRPAFAGIDAGDWVDPQGETRDVQVRLAPESRSRLSDLERLPITLSGADGPVTLPLGQIATVRQNIGPAQIDHLDRSKVVTVQANTQERSLSEVMADILEGLEPIEAAFPPGYRITQGGEAKDQAEVFGQVFAALGTAVLLMYLILVMQFGSFLDPLAIMMSLPLSLIGVVLMLLITGDTLNIMSLIGVILLMGIVAKNAILLIDFAKWARERDGLSLRDALIEAGAIRLRPILMTTFALIAGMLPVAIGAGEGADFRAPLGRAVIGGVITSTVLTLIVIPTFYEIFDQWRSWFSRKFGFRVKQKTAEHRLPGLPRPVPEAGD